MLTDEEIDSLANQILLRIIEDERSSPLFHEILQTDSGELIPVYASTSEQGYGSFICEFMSLAAIRKIIAECEKLFDGFAVEFKDHETGLAAQRKMSEASSAENREIAIRVMAECASLHLITSFRTRLCEMLEDAVEDSAVIANGVLAAVVARRLRAEEVGDFTADARPDIDQAVRRAADKRHALVQVYRQAAARLGYARAWAYS